MNAARFPMALLLLPVLLGGCKELGLGQDEPAADPAAQAKAAAEPGIDWSRCRIPGLGLPVEGKLFVVDGGPPPEDAEPGRESIRRVDIVVPGTVSLLLTAPDTTVWLLRPSPETKVLAVFASGTQPQRITGQGLGSRLARSQALGDDCGRYWLADGVGKPLEEASRRVFGRPHDALYGLRGGRAVIGAADEAPKSGSPSSDAPPSSPQATRVDASGGNTPVLAPDPVAPPPPPKMSNDERNAAAAKALNEGLRAGRIRYANAGDMNRWKRRYEQVSGRRINPDRDSFIAHMDAYLVVEEFTIPDGLSGANSALFLVERGAPPPENLSSHSPVLDIETGACLGSLCRMMTSDD